MGALEVIFEVDGNSETEKVDEECIETERREIEAPYRICNKLFSMADGDVLLRWRHNEPRSR